MPAGERESEDEPGLNEMPNGAEDTEEDEKRGGSNIRPSEEGVFAADP